MTQETPSIAVVGLSCRFPGADTPAEFWNNLRHGVDSISHFTLDELAASGADLEAARDPRYIPARAILTHGASFDAAFFGISPREAEILDPQHRVFLECAWEAMEDGGYAPGASDARVGVFASAGTNTYLFRNIMANRELCRSTDGFQIFLGNDKDFIPTRVSYKLNLRGPSLAVTTACSSSLVAVHTACQSLLGFQCDMALAGAVSIHSPEKEGYLYQEGGIHSPDGRCRAFDANAAGTVGGSGCGVVLLKRLEDALADGDTIHAVIRGSAINNDGSGKVGYTAPSVEGQAEAIAEAHAVAGIHPDSISYIEAHGTGTVLGDPIEIEALTRAFRRLTARRTFCVIGSAKTNIGHLDAAAGMAGLIKTILALKHRELPATLHFTAPNPRIPWTDSPFYVNAALTPWTPNEGPRRAGVSSFGIGGTNAHLVLEEAPSAPSRSSSRPLHVLPISAKTPAALAHAAQRLAAHLDTCSLPDAAYTLQTGRTAFSYRAAVVAGSSIEAIRQLRGIKPAASAERPAAFLFPGQGAQQAGMFDGLYQTEPVFRETVDRCARHLTDLDLRSILHSAESLTQTQFTQPAIFVVEYAMATWLASLGIRPTAMIGHSLGEYTAACLAGVFSLENALKIVALRGRLMASLPPGQMLAVPLTPAEIEPWLSDGLAIAARNAPGRSVVSGSPGAIARLDDALEQQGFSCQVLRTSHAFHSPMMEPILAEFSAALRGVPLAAPHLPYISNVTGTWITAQQATDPDYWTRHLRDTVQFADGLACLLADLRLALIQVGPGGELLSMARRQPNCGDRPLLESEPVPNLIAKLWTAGVPVDWSGLHSGESRTRISLPTYPFERQRYYIQPGSSPEPAKPSSSPLDWLYTPTWTRSLSSPHPEHDPGPWLILADHTSLANELAAELGNTTVIERVDEYASLSTTPLRIVHLGPDFYRVFHLLRALGEKGAAGIQLDLVSTGIYDVTGDEQLHPDAARLLAFVRVAPQEYPGLTCRLIDAVPPGLHTLAAELQTSASDPVVALRGRHRWVQTITPLTPQPGKSLLEPHGTYLITGGHSGLGAEFARHLANHNLVLVSRSPSPAPITFHRADVTAQEQRVERDLAIRRLDSYDGLEESLNRLSAAHILAYFRERGVPPEGRFDRDELMRRVGVLPKFERLVDYFLAVLREDGLTRLDTINAADLSEELRRQFPGFTPTIALLDHCGQHFGRALAGEIDAVSVLFPDGKSGLMLEAGRDTVEHLNSRVYRVLLKKLLSDTIARSDGRKIRILEVGAGNGVLTGELLPILAGANVEYHFTDLGRSFVLTAEARAAERGLDFMRFGVLDIAAPPEPQGFTPESFDFVFGLDVVHATPNIAKTLTNLRRFLKPGGSLALIETLRVARWNQMIFGLTEGWWNFEDPALRVNGTPVLNLENWQQVLESSGYTSVTGYPLTDRAHTDSGLLLAQNPPLSEHVLHLQADVSDAAQMDAVVAQTLARFGRLDGIFHCAAVDDQGSIQWKTPRFEELEFAPKIRGTEVLLDVAARTRARFLLLCSSLNTLTGGAGQIGYCAANSYLDAVAHAQTQNPLTEVIAVNWDRWQGIGMAADFEAWHERRTGETLSGGLTVQQGLAILDRVLTAGTPPQVIVSKVNPAVPKSAAPKKQPAVADNSVERPDGPVESAIASVFASTLGLAAVGRHDSFAALGGDSLIAIQVVSRLRESLQVELPLRSIFESPTVAALAECVANHRWATDSSTAAPAGAEMEEGVL